MSDIISNQLFFAIRMLSFLIVIVWVLIPVVFVFIYLEARRVRKIMEIVFKEHIKVDEHNRLVSKAQKSIDDYEFYKEQSSKQQLQNK